MTKLKKKIYDLVFYFDFLVLLSFVLTAILSLNIL